MKVLHLNDHLKQAGGVETYLRSVVTKLAASKFDIVVAHGNEGELEGTESVLLPVLSNPNVSVSDEAYRSLSEMIRQQGVEVAHIHNVFNAGAIEACLDHVPTVLHLHDYRYMCPSSNFYQRRLGRRCGRTCGVACFGIGPLAGCQTPRPKAARGFYRRVRFVQRNASRFRAILANSNHVKETFLRGSGGTGAVEVLHYFTGQLNPIGIHHLFQDGHSGLQRRNL